MKTRVRFVLWGTSFGFVLSRARVTDYDTISNMFGLKDPYLLLVIGGAVALGAITLRLAARLRARAGRPVVAARPPITAAGIAGAAIFGIGWGLSGACPGTALTQLGEGKMLALLTVAGIFGGTALHAWASEWWARRRLARAMQGLSSALAPPDGPGARAGV